VKKLAASNAENQWVGVGFKARYLDALMADDAPVGWLEIHAENFMVDGGPQMAMLDDIAGRYPISCHGVGLSIGGEAPLDQAHLARLKALQDRLNPALFSEHLAWSSHGGAFYNDLLPVPYTERTLQRVAAHVDTLQQAVGRQILLENPSSYLRFAESTLSETDFLAAVSDRTGCGLLLDVNNIFVSATNMGYSAAEFLQAFPVEQVGEVHLAGHEQDADEHGELLLIDSHNNPVVDDVWGLYDSLLSRIGTVPTLIEWDNDLPEWPVLLAEAQRAAAHLARAQRQVA